ncbi:lanthionine synthetase C family protein [Micromonospora sp. WMMD1102]|uniref:lanthionine synthetase C family protein n=1 Tax=Micromonospora sp. WMMD1102 TaxID=3016105 RepID=UPI002415532D|nr:lanthionine synthetase C family protein [Micromonospora sp. WMMD1102]MDG4787152.1 lanthionine synthetase C family protein [Micromonospora sp. WMMD1102]
MAGWRQSLADGAPGAALPLIERARAGGVGWEPAHQLVRAMVSEPVQAHPDVAGLFYGAPAVAYVLHAAGHPGYRTALATLDRAVTTLIHARLDAAHRRIDQGLPPSAREYDLIGGLTGLGVYLMRRGRDPDLLRQVLAYLVRLTQPVRVGGQEVPGWWASGSPDVRQLPRWADGHAGFGMAHGVTGPLALLSVTMRGGVVVDGQTEAILTICGWLDRWRTGHGRNAWWPEAISGEELRAGVCTATGPRRPSWCYGTPGITRALQLAAIAVGDSGRARSAQEAFLGCLADEQQLSQLAEVGLCHGWAGLAQTARRMASDSGTVELSDAARDMIGRLGHRLGGHGAPADGFLDGAVGAELVAEATATTPGGHTTWDGCLLLI